MYPSFGDLTTHITIMLKEASFGDDDESAKMNVMSQTQIEIKSNENKGLNLGVSEINEQAIPHKMTHNYEEKESAELVERLRRKGQNSNSNCNEGMQMTYWR